jgi:hypothetical protein
MPAYTLDFTTDAGPQRLQFTLDDDRPLAPQLFQVHEELSQRGMIIRGGPQDEIGAFWNGAEVDQTKTAQELGLSPRQPIELRMRPAPARAPQRAPEAPLRTFVTKTWIAAALAGFFGALAAWTAAATIDDLGGVIDSYAGLDAAAAVLLGLAVGAVALGAEALREARNVALAVLVGAMAGALGGFVGALAGGALRSALASNASAAAFVGVRVGAWALLGGALGAALALPGVRRDPRRVLDALVFGLIAGAMGGLIYSFPGWSDVWQLVAFLLVGSAVAVGISAPAIQRAGAILELESAGRRRVGLLTLREWGLDERTGASLRHDGEAARVEWNGGRFAIVPAEGSSRIVVSGHPVATPIYLRNYDVIDVGTARYRFRRLRETPA